MAQPACENKNGFIILISVLIISAVGLAIVLVMIFSGVVSTKNAVVWKQASQARGLANACAETALLGLKQKPPVITPGNLSFASGTCAYAISYTGSQYNISTSSTVQDIVRKVKINVTSVSPTIKIGAWEEVADF